MTDTRTQLKTRFAAGQRIGESDFAALVDSLAHLSEDVSSGSLASGDSVSQLSTALDDLKAFAESHRSEFDGYVGTHPTFEQVTDADTAVRDELNATITQSVQSLQSTDLELAQAANENTDILLSLMDIYLDSFNSVDSDIESLQAQSATNELLNLKVSELQSEIESKADIVHTHDEYATKVSIGSFITAEDIPNFAAEIHQHTVADITDIDGMFATDEKVLELIEENRTTIDVNAIIADGYYTKGEVDQKFYVQSLNTSQITGFTSEVSSIATSIAQVELATAKSEIEEDLNLDQMRVSIAAADASVLASARAYSDQRVTDLIGGASEAYDTLKEIQDAVEGGGGATADVINDLTFINQEIDDNDTELENIRKWLGRTVYELEVDPFTTKLSNDIQPGDTSLSLLNSSGISVGDELVIGLGSPGIGETEVVTIADENLGLVSPIINFHPFGTIVSLRNPLISSISSISGGSASSSDLEALQDTVSQLQNTVTTLQNNQETLQIQLADQEVLIAELEEMIEEGAYSQNNYFARYYVTDGYAATFESGYYAVEGYTTVGYTSQYT